MFLVQVKKIAAVFKVLPSSLYLVKEFEGMVIFPHEQTGRFNRQVIDVHSSYEVHGEKSPGSSMATTHTPPSVPFGAYTGPSPHPATGLLSSPVTFSASGRKKSTFRKTIALVSLSRAPTDRPCTSTSPGLTYSIVTQVVVALEMSRCGPTVVAELVKQQVGYDVILLDSKCFPVLDNEISRSSEFWKSTRKIMAASKSLYIKLKGSSADPERAKIETGVARVAEGGPIAKRPCSDQSNPILEELDRLGASLQRVENFLDFIGHLKQAFECVVCRSVSRKPVTATCCNRLVGCEDCVEQWVERNQTCPLCACGAAVHDMVELKGFDHVLEAAAVAGSHAPSQHGGREANSPCPSTLPRPSRSGSAGQTSHVTLTTGELSDSDLDVTA